MDLIVTDNKNLKNIIGIIGDGMGIIRGVATNEATEAAASPKKVFSTKLS